MDQIKKFYLTEFLKTQNYFIPIMILFLQFNKLNYTQIFILYSIQSAIIFLLEIPSGVIADQFGKKPALLVSRLSLIPAYLIFSFTSGFSWFLIAMIFLAVNKAFKSGTHKAYIYNYLKQTGSHITPTEVFGKSKFWARIGESIASVSGGYIAVKFGFESVFLAALIPAFLNILNTITYSKIDEKNTVNAFRWNEHFKHISVSFREIRSNSNTVKIILNSAVFMFCIEASEKFLQPYMVSAGIKIKYFGFIYMVFMLFAAFGSRYAFIVERYFKRSLIINRLGLFAVIPFLLIGLGIVEKWGVLFFLVIFLLKNLRRPILTTELNMNISSSSRATILSITALSKSLFLMLFLPVIGYISDKLSFTAVFIVLGMILLINRFVLKINPDGINKTKKSH